MTCYRKNNKTKFFRLLLCLLLLSALGAPFFASAEDAPGPATADAPIHDTSTTGDCPNRLSEGFIRISVYIPGITETKKISQSGLGVLLEALTKGAISGGAGAAGSGGAIGSKIAQLGATKTLSTGLEAASGAGQSASEHQFNEKTCYYVKDLQHYIKGLYEFGVAIGGFLCMVMIMIGGTRWVSAGGSPEKITKAKEQMLNAIAGFFLLLASYTLLNLVNPNTLLLRGPAVTPQSIIGQFTAGILR